MHEAKIRLKAISPLFMRGADQRKAEFRSASVKGVMHWWFRALAGNYLASIDELREIEGSFFGSAGGKRSRVIVEARALDKPAPIYFRGNRLDRDSWVEWWENGKRAGLQYLFFSIKLLARKNQLKEFYKPGSRFEITIKSHDSKAYKAAMASLWSAVALGGFGFRARRGAGSLWFDGRNEAMEALKLPTALENPDDLKAGIQRAIKLVGNAIGREELPIKPVVDHPTLTENSSAVAVLKEMKDPKLALKEFQRTYQSFRRGRRPTTRNIVFGLPIVKGKLGRVRNDAKKARRASPLLVSVKPFGGSYRVVLVKMRTARFHENSKLDQLADWEALELLDERFNESVVFGNPLNFM